MKNNKKFGKILSIDFWMEFLWLFIIFITPLIFSWWSISSNVFELPKAVFFCTLTEVLAVVFLLKIFVKNKLEFKLNFKIILLFLIWLMAVFSSLFFAVDSGKSFFGSFERQQGVWFLFHLAVFFFILILNIKNFSQIKRILKVILISSFLVCLYGLIQFFGWDWWSWRETVSGTKRIFSTLGQPNFLAHYLIIIIPFSVFSLFFVFRSTISRFLVIVLIFMQTACLLFTLSRAAWLGFAFQLFLLLIFLLLFFKEKWLKNKKIVISSLFLFIFVFILLFSLINGSGSVLGDRAKSALNLDSGSVKMRIFYWQASWEEIKQMNPTAILFGYGLDNIDHVFVKYYQPAWGIYEEADSFPDRSHNAILDALFFYGLVGFIALSAFWLFVFANLIKHIRFNRQNKQYFWLTATCVFVLAGYFVNILFSFSVITTWVYLFLILAIAYFLLSKDKKTIKLNFNFFSSFSKILIFVFFFVFIIIISWLFNVRLLIADYYYSQVVSESIAEAKCLPIIHNLNKTIGYQPQEKYYQRKYIHYHLNCLKDKDLTAINNEIKYNIDQILDIMDRPVLDYRLKFKLAHEASLFGYYFDEVYYEVADKAYQNLLAINPNFLGIYSDYGRMKLWQKNYEEAIEILKKGLLNTPDLESPYMNREHRRDVKNKIFVFYDTLGQAYFYKKEYKQAIMYFDKALKIKPFSADIYKEIGDCYYMQNDLDKAIHYYEKSLSLNPNDHSLSESLPLIYDELNK